MNSYFGYVRVSTVKQGEKGSSLGEQRAAIEAYAQRHGLVISEWFEELETAAKQGRPVFTRMLNALQAGKARGVITHKIDRSARNLKDWAMLGDLIDRGTEMHFAHESIDLTSRGGRLSADIQAVVAADYVRNLRDEVRKGFYGRLKQGLYPLQAPVGYLDQGGGRPKIIDPIRGPLVRKVFDLYATGTWSLQTIAEEMRRQGLRTKAGNPISKSGFSTILNNPFYIGIIRIDKTNEAYSGVHDPLVKKETFDRVRGILRGRVTHRQQHRFRYQRLLQCAACGHSLTAEQQKGRVYYRCHTRACPTTTVREDRIDELLREHTLCFRLNDADLDDLRHDIDAVVVEAKATILEEKKALELLLAAVDARLGKLTDAYIDQVIERELYEPRKEKLLDERANIISRSSALEHGEDPTRSRADKMFELVKTLRYMPFFDSDNDLREILKNTTSNLSVSRKNLVIHWRNPFAAMISDDVVRLGGPHRAELRTFKARICKALIEYIQEGLPVEMSEAEKENIRESRVSLARGQ
ncbi:MAG: recombinase family protein [Alphaproteobacteria bacterium]|nr:recombinase family protein [Alphaproteobacteria bacterium]